MRKPFFILYFFIVHVLLGMAYFTSDFPPQVAAALQRMVFPPSESEMFIRMLRTVHGHIDATVPEGATIFLGDSITMFLATSALAAYSVNYGIGWQRTDQLLDSMDLYHSLTRATRVVITIGTNDLLQHRSEGIESRYRAILAKIPGRPSIIMSSIPPLGNDLVNGRDITVDDVQRVIANTRAACEADQRCRFVNVYEALIVDGFPAPGVLMADGIHLNTHGYARWIETMRPAMTFRPE